MKFTDGFWQVRHGVTIEGAAQVSDYQFDGRELRMLCPAWQSPRGARTVGGFLMTVTLSSPADGVIRVRAVHHKGGAAKIPKAAVSGSQQQVQIAEEDDIIIYTAGDLQARINKEYFCIDFFSGGRRLSGSANRCLAHIYDMTDAPAADPRTNNGRAYMREQLDIGVGECLYGLGERFTPFVKNGQNVEIWNRDGGTATDQGYKNIPFYVSNRGYGVFVNDTGRVSFEAGTERVSKMQFSMPGEELDYYFIGGGAEPRDSIKTVVSRYTALTGRPALPPEWSFGLWLTTSFTTNYDEATVTSFLDGFKQRDLPLDVFHFDCFWMKGQHWCDFEWDEAMFPDPAGMLKRMRARGLHICVWINPYIAQQSPLFDEGMEHGYLLRHPNGDVYQTDDWQPGMGIVDFTNPAARAWYQDKLGRLVDMGVDCFKTDFGERIPTDVAYCDGSDAEHMHNYFTFLYNRTVFELLERKRGVGEALLFARSACAGGQQFPVHWGGDCTGNFESMAESLRGGLSLSMSGFGFWASDIGGFENSTSADVYKRWVAFGLFSSHSRLHGSSSYRVPWTYDEEAVDVLRFFTKLKKSLMPYIMDCARMAHEQGVPLMRPMVMEFPADPMCAYLDRQYMFGGDILVAPVFSPDGKVSYYLPAGKWRSLIDGSVRDGGRWFEETHGYFSLPLYRREG